MLGIEPIEDLAPETLPAEEEVPIPETLPADPDSGAADPPESEIGVEFSPVVDPEGDWFLTLDEFINEWQARLNSVVTLADLEELRVDFQERFTDLSIEERFNVVHHIVADGEITEAELIVCSLIQEQLTVPEKAELLQLFDAAVADGTIPEAEFWFLLFDDWQIDHWELQDNPFNAPVVVQKMILDAIFSGTPGDGNYADFYETTLTMRAILDGTLSLTTGGMQSSHIGEILERYGVTVDHTFDTTVAELQEKLAAGHAVIVTVDADEIWDEIDDDEWDGGDGANHVVWLLEIDTSDPGNPVAVINDSGIEDGAALRVPLDNFVDAFADGGNHAIITQEPVLSPPE